MERRQRIRTERDLRAVLVVIRACCRSSPS